MQGMSSSKSRSRAPEGVPTGGQFATERRPEVGPSTLLNLSDPPLLDDTHHAHPERVVYAERVGALPYEMPPVCAEHQAAGHPENSQEAFEQYVAGSSGSEPFNLHTRHLASDLPINGARATF